MVSIAQKNLFHHKTRLAMGLGGILFAVVLMVFAVGMTYGTMRYAVDLVDHSDADIWVLSEKTQDLLAPSRMAGFVETGRVEMLVVKLTSVIW